MRKHIIIFVGILLVGSLAIALPYFLSSSKKEKESNMQQLEASKKVQMIKDVSSNSKTVKVPEIPQNNREAETYDKTQMYFENVENLYKVLKFAQVEEMKQRVQSYVHESISKDILDCSILTDSIKKDGNKINFIITLSNKKILELEVIDNEGKPLDISITNSID